MHSIQSAFVLFPLARAKEKVNMDPSPTLFFILIGVSPTFETQSVMFWLSRVEGESTYKHIYSQNPFHCILSSFLPAQTFGPCSSFLFLSCSWVLSFY